MKFQVQCTLRYQAEDHSSAILNVRALHPESENISCDPRSHLVADTTTNDHRFLYLDIIGPGIVDFVYAATVSPVHRRVDCSTVLFREVPPFDHAVLPFLNPSRYCPSDRLGNFAETRFSKYANAFERVLAITDWIYEHIKYVSGSTDSSTNASDVIMQQEGVCRDFAHLAITLCRALNIPARYISAYAYHLEPQDFHACFEAFIGSEWIVFDATRLAPLNGLIKIAHGCDAADTAVSSLFGNVAGTLMDVQVRCEDTGFIPFFYEAGKFEGFSISQDL